MSEKCRFSDSLSSVSPSEPSRSSFHYAFKASALDALKWRNSCSKAELGNTNPNLQRTLFVQKAGTSMRPSQTFQKRQRELARQEKQRAKAQRKQQRKIEKESPDASTAS